ncbi:MAG: VOC family protein [Victivallaceae bacterium]
MESRRFGILLRVNQLDVCRQFYRDLLGIGDPVIDSTFAVEFHPSRNFAIRLEASEAPYLEHESAATSWMLEVSDFDAIRERLADAGYPLAEKPEERPGGLYFRGNDPEGNTFYIAQKSGPNLSIGGADAPLSHPGSSHGR